MHTSNTSSNTHNHGVTRFTQIENVALPVTMSSREIADLVSSRHDSVKRTIERLAEKGFIGTPPVVEYLDGLGRPAIQYQVGKRDSFVVVAQLSPSFTATLVDRWQELEEQVARPFQIPATYAEALQIAADQAKENQHLQLVILKQAPKVAAIKRLAAAEGAICITDAAKHLQVRPKVLFDYLALNRWIYRRGGSSRWIGMEPRITSGFLVHKVTSLKPDAETGAERAAFQPLITPKGLARLAEKNIGASL
ncbi:phage antirepressor KilAC domain-containing protein [Pseudomonas sp.]|uniref:phage antirepressor KilAC domain-containing protein n=1 Tax=Pseudomonas sp. TaxID=306 RepID=UPI003FD79B20